MDQFTVPGTPDENVAAIRAEVRDELHAEHRADLAKTNKHAYLDGLFDGIIWALIIFAVLAVTGVIQ